MADRFITYLEEKYPKGNKKLEEEIKSLKRKLEVIDDEFSDCDENALCEALDEIENKKPKPDPSIQNQLHTCDICSKVFRWKKSKIRHMKSHFTDYVCHICQKKFTRTDNLRKHLSLYHDVGSEQKSYEVTLNCVCKHCGVSFSNYNDLFQHVTALHPLNNTQNETRVENNDLYTAQSSGGDISKNDLNHTCKHCGVSFSDYENLYQHVVLLHPFNNQIGGETGSRHSNDHSYVRKTRESDINHADVKKKNRRRSEKNALNGTANSITFNPTETEKYDLLQFYSDVKENLVGELKVKKQQLRDIKWYVNTRVEMVRDLEDGRTDIAKPYFRSKTYTSLAADDNYESEVNETFLKMNKGMEEFINKGSSWRMNEIIDIEVNIVKYSPLGGSSYIPLPSKIQRAKGVLNIENKDQKCFIWSILAALHPKSNHPECVKHYKHFEKELDMTGIDFPVSLKNVEKFERQNKISVNIFGFDMGEIFPLYLSKLIEAPKEVDLLHLKDGDKTHYCTIKNLNRFLYSTKSKTNTKHYYCRRCLHGFIRQDLLESHYSYCKQIDFQRVSYPEEGKNDILQFKEFHKQIRVGFTIYADFECLAKKISSCSPNPNISSTTHQTEYEASGYCYSIICSNDKFSKDPVIYRGENAAEHFLDSLMEEESYIREKLNQAEPLIMTEETEKQFQDATHCYICGKLFNKTVIKVRDHEHLGYNADINSPNYSNYRGASCQSCNLNLKQPSFIPVVFHNGRNFDYKLLCQVVGKYKDKKVSVIATNMEKFISFSIGNLRFIDSYQFLNSSLESLIDNLAQDGSEHFKQFRKIFPSEELFKLMLRKNVFCYDYIDSFAKFDERELPPKKAFYNRLLKQDISDDDYEHCQKVWKTFNMKTLGDFQDLYNLTDCVLLSDIFERFRTMTLDYYGLDACHFFTAPGLAWSSALKMTDVNLELITDPLKYNMFELSMRGGISMISKKYAKANNPYLSKSYNPEEPKSYIIYLDACNLYGYSMQQPLPTGLMRWLDETEIEHFDVNSIPPNGDTGYFLEVDLEYPSHLHNDHNCYPLAPSHRTVTIDDLSPHSREIWDKFHKIESNKKRGENGGPKVTSMPKVKKLIPTLENRSNYILHYKNLQLYLELGLKLTKIHKVLEFHQSPWLQKYINFNTEKRKHAKNEFEKDFFKLLCNSVFGKTMENLRNRVDIKLINTDKLLAKCVAKPSFERFEIINKDLVVVENKKVNLFLNKPCYVGATILELSKAHMYNFHYNFMKKKYGDNMRLLFTDTDSLCYEIHCEGDLYDNFMNHKHLFDFSNYPKNHPLYHEMNKKKPGTFKDETAGRAISEFVGLRSKMYSFRIGEENDEKRTAKGIVKNVIENELKHEDYKNCLFNNTATRNEMNLIRSENHKLYMNRVVKTGLCSFDDKRYCLKDSFETLAYGHFLLKNQQKQI